MTLGFTGTSHGMTQAQTAAVGELFAALRPTALHHGVCIGADAQAHHLALDLRIYLVGHPPDNPKKMARLTGFDELRPPKPYLVRNQCIVLDGTNGLIAVPRSAVEPQSKRGQGTWTTIGYARKAGRRIWIVEPDGAVRIELGGLSMVDGRLGEQGNLI